MTFISYAQNFEDVMLKRAFKHIGWGFYIDVGANDPEIDSVTKAFYDMGWRGINIEPATQWYEKLEQQRPRDINLNCAAGKEKGEITFYDIPDTGISTVEKQVAERHKNDGGYHYVEKRVPVITLTEVCKTYHVAPIHFLKIDVEGHEKSVLEGIDFSIIRPWIIIVESTFPLTQEQSYESWEELLKAADYEVVYFDGLNRFYVAKEQEELKHSFSSPPNVFDDFSLSGRANHSFCEKLNQIIRAKEKELGISQQKNIELGSKTQTLQHDYEITRSRLESTIADLALSHQNEKNHVEALQQKAQRIEGLEAALAKEHLHSQSLQNKWDKSREKLDELNRSSHHWHMHATAKEQAVEALLRSTSWRLTWPLRAAKRLIIWLFKLPVRFIRAIIREILAMMIRNVIKYSSLRSKLSKILRGSPKLHSHLRQFALSRGILNTNGSFNSQKDEVDLSDMTPRARVIYQQLKQAIEDKRTT